MKKVSHKAPKVKANPQRGFNATDTQRRRTGRPLDTRIALIQALIPLGLDAVAEELQEEVSRLAR